MNKNKIILSVLLLLIVIFGLLYFFIFHIHSNKKTVGTDWVIMDSKITQEAVCSMWGSSANDIFAVGDAGTTLHYGGSSWSKLISGTASDIKSVWGASPNNVFAAGSNGLIFSYKKKN